MKYLMILPIVLLLFSCGRDTYPTYIRGEYGEFNRRVSYLVDDSGTQTVGAEVEYRGLTYRAFLYDPALGEVGKDPLSGGIQWVVMCTDSSKYVVVGRESLTRALDGLTDHLTVLYYKEQREEARRLRDQIRRKH